MYRTVVTICTPSLTFNNSTFCPHSVFMCFVWISEQTAIISLYSINWLVCITETECVYCAVRTGSLNLFHFNAACHHGRRFDPRPQYESYFVERFYSEYFGFPLYMSIHHCFVFVFMLMLPLSEGQAGQTCEIYKATLFLRLGSAGIEIWLSQKGKITTLISGTCHRGTMIYQRGVPFYARSQELREATVRCVMSVRLSAWNHLAPTWRIFTKI